MKICVVTDNIERDAFEKSLGPVAEVTYAPSNDEEEVIHHARGAQILVSLYEPITRRVLEALQPDLRYVALVSIGFNTVDIEAAKELGVKISNNPYYCMEEVADHVAAMILAMTRQLFPYDRLTKSGVWSYEDTPLPVHRLSSYTLGLAGFGNISRRVAKRMKAFGCRVLAYDPFLQSEAMHKEGCEKVDFDELLARSDILSLHMPLTESTQGLFDEEALRKLKRGVLFVNCARGEIVDEKALIKLLDKGHIACAALDVLSTEFPDAELLASLNRDDIILTPHSAFYSLEAWEEASSHVLDYIHAYMRGDMEKVPLVAGRE